MAGIVGQPGPPGRPPAALAGDQLVAAAVDRRGRGSAAARRSRRSTRPARRATPRRSGPAAGAGWARCRRPGSSTSGGRRPSTAVGSRRAGSASSRPLPSPLRRAIAAPPWPRPGRRWPRASVGSNVMIGCPNDGASDSRTDAGDDRPAAPCRRSARAPRCTTWSASLVRASYITQHDRADLERRVEVALDEVDVAQQLAEALERVVLALDRHQHLGGRGAGR